MGSSESVSGPGSTAERALDYSNKFRDFLEANISTLFLENINTIEGKRLFVFK